MPPAIEPARRLMLLARLVQLHLGADAAEALRLAADLARTLDQLLIEEVDPARLAGFAADLPDLSLHWQKSLDQLRLILADWPAVLADRGRIDLADRRNRLLAAVARRWRERAARRLRLRRRNHHRRARGRAAARRRSRGSTEGMVVLPALDLDMADEEWDALGPHEPDESGHRRRSIETHPQFHLKLLLDRMSVGRGRGGALALGRRPGCAGGAQPRHRQCHGAGRSSPRNGRALRPAERRLTGVRALELADPAEEAQAIAIALREALEEPGRTAALVTPDRGARPPRLGASEALGSRGRRQRRPAALADAARHPAARGGDRGGRAVRAGAAAGLAQASAGRWRGTAGSTGSTARAPLDLALRGPRPPAGLDGIAAHLADRSGRDAQAARGGRRLVAGGVAPLLAPLEQAFGAERRPAGLLAALREAASRLAGDAAWAGPAGPRRGRACSPSSRRRRGRGRSGSTPRHLPDLLERLMADVAVRPPYGQHPRLAIWGLIEARLQHADLLVLGGLNEGVWPALPAPDPWLAPRLRAELGLPSLERRIGLAAHDFAAALGARQVLVTRARRDARAPAIASRFWLRLEAMTGGLTRAPASAQMGAGDRPAATPTGPPRARRRRPIRSCGRARSR